MRLPSIEEIVGRWGESLCWVGGPKWLSGKQFIRLFEFFQRSDTGGVRGPVCEHFALVLARHRPVYISKKRSILSSVDFSSSTAKLTPGAVR